MKKRFGIISMIVVLLVCFAVCFTACGSKGDNNGDSINIADDYNYAQIEAKINEMAGTNGVFVKVRVSSSSSGEADETYYVAFGVKNHIYYYITETTEAYYDLSDNTKGVVYEKNATGAWDKDIYYYGTSFTKENMDAYANALSTGVFGWLGYYHYLGAGEGTKSDTTFLNRSCTKYSISTNYVGYGASYSQEVIIDKETGACLKYAASASAGGESGSVSIECTEFNTNWTPTIPAATDISTTEEHGTQGQGGTGGSGTGGTGTGGQGGSGGSGEGGQGGQGGSGEGGQGGSGGSGEGGEQVISNPFVGKRFDVESLSVDNDALETIFENAYIDLYNDGTFEMVSSMGVIIGSYRVVLNYAVLDPYLAYSNNYYSYDSDILDTFQGAGVVLNNDAYTMPVDDLQVGSEYIDFTFNLVISSDSPMHADIPADPNGYIDSSEFDAYQVDQEEWEYIILEKQYLYGNYTISTKNRYDVDMLIEANYGYIKETWNSGELYYYVSNVNNDNHTITYKVNYGSGWSDSINNYDDFFDFETGFIPAQFLKSTYSTTGQYYYINSFTYTDSDNSTHSIINYQIWFERDEYNEVNVKKIQYTETGTTYTYTFTNIGTTSFVSPSM